MIVTVANCKTLLGITSSTYDSLLALEIPMIQEAIIQFLKRYFKSDLDYSSKTISFSGTTISDSASQFNVEGLLIGDYMIQGSKYNDGFVTVSVVASGALTTSETLVTETAGETILLTRVVFPKELQLIASKMVGYNIFNKYGAISESISRYSVTYGQAQNNILGYPDSLTGGLLKYRRVYNDI
jgi:hypothetical protein